MIIIFAVEAKNITLIWSDVRPILEKVLKYNEHTYDMAKVCNDLVSGKQILLCIKDDEEYLACIICDAVEDDGKKILHMPIVCGTRMNEWIDLAHETVPKLARTLGFDMITTKGRKGWTRVLKKYGYDEMYTMLSLLL